jgi:hypothetical protein
MKPIARASYHGLPSPETNQWLINRFSPFRLAVTIPCEFDFRVVGIAWDE